MGKPEVPISELLTRYIPVPECGCFFTQRHLAELYGVTQTTISLIKRGVNWRGL
jgi:hypothetical protein